MDSNRRSFLKKAGVAAVAVSAAPLGLGAAAIAEAAESPASGGSPARELEAKRAFSAGKFALELDGAMVGFLDDADGGRPYGEVLEFINGSELVTRKSIGRVKYDDITLSTGLGMSPAFHDWIKATLSHHPVRKNGAIVALDFSFKEIGRIEFIRGLITEIGFPALDAASKDAAKMTLKFAPETTRVKKGSGQVVTPPPGGAAQKKWMVSNFRLKIDGLDETVTRVNKIEALTIKQKVVEFQPGETRDPVLEPTTLEYPNLVITFPENAVQPTQDWFDSFVLGGDDGPDKEKGGSIDYLTPDMKTVLGGLQFFHLGIFRLDEDEDDGTNVRRLRAEMYCEEMTFSIGQVPPPPS